MIVVLTSCTKEPEQNLPNIETDTLHVSYYGIADSILVSTELDLNITIMPSGTTWLRTRINTTSGNQKYIVIEANQNSTRESRTAQVNPLFEVVGNAGALAPSQIDNAFPKLKVGGILGLTVTVNEALFAHTPEAGVKT